MFVWFCRGFLVKANWANASFGTWRWWCCKYSAGGCRRWPPLTSWTTCWRIYLSLESPLRLYREHAPEPTNYFKQFSQVPLVSPPEFKLKLFQVQTLADKTELRCRWHAVQRALWWRIWNVGFSVQHSKDDEWTKHNFIVIGSLKFIRTF